MITINELMAQVEEIVEIIQSNRKQAAPRMNVLDITGVSHLEVKNSDILAFLLNPHAPHKKPQIGSLFLEHLKGKLPKCIKGEKISRVNKEQPTNENRRIDLLLETDRGEFIIIENKVGAGDLENQLEDYITWVQGKNNEAPLTIYLTPDGNIPDEYSLLKTTRETLEKQNRFLCLSYKDDVIAWLDDVLQTLEPGTDQDLLRSAIIQYKDAVDGFCGQRNEDNMEQAKIVEYLVGKFNLDGRSSEAIQELQSAANGLQAAMDQITIMQFLLELYELLRQDGNHRVYLVLDQDRESDSKKWIDRCKTITGTIGVELALEESDKSPIYGIGIEFEKTTRETSVYFGIMAHDNGLKFKAPKIGIPIKLEGIGSFSSSAYDWWWHVAAVESWFKQALFRFGYDGNWQNENGSLALYAYNNWFSAMK